MRRLALLGVALLGALMLLARDDDAPRRATRDVGGPAGPAALHAPPGSPRRSPETSEAVAAARPIELRVGGELLLDGRRVGLETLRKACAGRRAVTLAVEGGVPWAHVELALMALQAAGVGRVRFEPPGAEAVFDSDFWQQDARHLVGGHLAGLVEVTSADLGDRDFPAREAARIARETKLKPLARVLPQPREPFGVIAPALVALRDAAVETEFHFAWGDGGLPDTVPLPEAPELGTHADYRRCICRAGLAIDVPLADEGEPDKRDDPDERLVVHLDRAGRLATNADPGGRLREDMSLDEFASELRVRKERYGLEMRNLGKQGLDEGKWSKLYVLIRADRGAPARQVGFILHVHAQERFYKVQFAVCQARLPPGCVSGEAKLQVFLPTTGFPGIVSRDERALHAYVDRGGFGVGGAGAKDATELRRLAGVEGETLRDGDRRPIVALHVDPDATHDRMIAAVNALNAAGFEKIDFVGLPPPDPATRLAKPLPR
jgi:biopolymer transport protein ExbD